MIEKNCERCGKAFSPTGTHRNTIAYFKKKRFCSARCAGQASATITPVEERFRQYAPVGKPNECWEWTGARQKAGYGALTIRVGAVVGAHRLAWQLHFGAPIPNGMHVLHKCDNPPCVNPNHLFLGTPKINSDDKLAKGRANRSAPKRGEEHHATKVTAAAVQGIRLSTEKAKALASHYGVTPETIYNIRNRKTWRHVP